MKLKNKVALVTGSGRGLGRGIAKVLASEGAKIIVNGRKAGDLVATVEDVTNGGGEALAIAADVADSAQVDAMMKQIVEHFGTLDILVNNAAITPGGDKSRQARAEFLELMSTPVQKHSLEVTSHLTDEEWEKIIHVNLTGVFICMRAALRIMEPKKYGKIVNISSIAGVSGLSFHSPHYSASKAGVIGLTRSVGLEVIGAGINVNAIACGGILTETWEARFQGDGC
jgi:3-oxoacyl-[acyl-carrier protein] reductase